MEDTKVFDIANAFSHLPNSTLKTCKHIDTDDYFLQHSDMKFW